MIQRTVTISVIFIIAIFLLSGCTKTPINTTGVKDSDAGNNVKAVFENANSPEHVQSYCQSNEEKCKSYCANNPSNKHCKKPPKR